MTRRRPARPGIAIAAGGIAVLLSLPFGGIGAQGVPISAHFGALYAPTPERVWEAGFVTDRFTDNTKGSDSATAVREDKFDTKTRHYALRTTLGVNALYLMRVFQSPSIASTWRLGTYAGWLGDEPSRFFQNRFRHTDAGLDFIPVVEVERGTLGGVFGGVDRWVDVMPRNRNLNLTAYIGLDGNVSNFYDEAAIRMGMRTTYIDVFGWHEPPQFAVGLRKGLWVKPKQLLTDAPHDPTAQSMKDVIANTYTAASASVRLPLNAWFRSRSLIPDAEVGYTSHSGLFLAKPRAETGFKRLSETFQTFALLWGGGDLALETYNDSPGGKDIGPTYGVRMYGRWRQWGGSR